MSENQERSGQELEGDRNASTTQGEIADDLDTAIGDAGGVNPNTGAPNPVESNWLGDAGRTGAAGTTAGVGSIPGSNPNEQAQREADLLSDQGAVSDGEGSAERGGWPESQPGDLGSGQSGMGNNPPVDIVETGADLGEQPQADAMDNRTDPDFGSGGDLGGNSVGNREAGRRAEINEDRDGEPGGQNSAKSSSGSIGDKSGQKMPGQSSGSDRVDGGAGDREDSKAPGDLASDHATGTTQGNLGDDPRPGESATMNIGGIGSTVGESQTAMQGRLGSEHTEEGNWRDPVDEEE